MTPEIELLRSISYFSGLKSTELDSISKLIFEKCYDQGEMILFEGETTEVLYFVASGIVKLFKTSSDGKEQILKILRPGESFNDVPMFSAGLNPASAQTIGAVLLYGITKSDLETIIYSQPQIALNATRVMADKLRHMLALVEDLSFRQVIGRVAKILLEHAGDKRGTEPRITQQDMAAMAGTVREVVGRSLKTLEEEGIVKLDRHRIMITDEAALKNRVNPSL